VRRSEWRAANAEGKKVIKGSRFLLVTGCENPDSNGFARLAELTGLNPKISTAYILKEEFRHIYAVATNARSGAVRIRRWCALVEESGIEPLRRFARGLLRDLPAITAFFKHRITSGKIESFNNQIARLIHRACGMTNLRHLFLKMRAQSIKQI
jgi:transposase